jgi:hypothetical protein
MGWIEGHLDDDWKDFWGLDFWDLVQRRGVDVNTPEKGSRGNVFCFGGIYGFYAELRREIIWGNLDLLFFGFLAGDPRGDGEEGGNCVFLWGNFRC